MPGQILLEGRRTPDLSLSDVSMPQVALTEELTNVLGKKTSIAFRVVAFNDKCPLMSFPLLKVQPFSNPRRRHVGGPGTSHHVTFPVTAHVHSCMMM
jgi:hypothetical protein